jgi:hypothetical protein
LRTAWAKKRLPSQQNKLEVVVHVYNHTYAGGIGRRIADPDQPQAKMLSER